MPAIKLSNLFLLPELRLIQVRHSSTRGSAEFVVEKTSAFEVCQKCATPARGVYDHRIVRVKDEPIRGNRHVDLIIRKRRLWCCRCRLPFTEPIDGIGVGKRTTHRYRGALLRACEAFSDLKCVRETFRCSGGLLYKILYEQLELERRKHVHPWPKTLGIDEHYFKRARGHRQFVTMVVNMKGKSLMEVVEGRASGELEAALAHIPGRENVQTIVMDMSGPFRMFAKHFFPGAVRVADKFHVLRLLGPALDRARKQITGHRGGLPIRKLLLANGKNLEWRTRVHLYTWLEQYPELRELYHWKESLHGLYRCRGPKGARSAFITMTDHMAESSLPEIQTLRSTLMRWRTEILAYFRYRVTNGRTEGFNNKAKLVKRRGYGYRSFRNYRLRLLHACS